MQSILSSGVKITFQSLSQCPMNQGIRDVINTLVDKSDKIRTNRSFSKWCNGWYPKRLKHTAIFQVDLMFKVNSYCLNISRMPFWPKKAYLD